VQAGGLPMFAGMTVVAGLAGMLMGRALHRMRKFVPPEVAGTVALRHRMVASATSRTAAFC